MQPESPRPLEKASDKALHSPPPFPLQRVSHKGEKKTSTCPLRMKMVLVWFVTGFSMGSCELAQVGTWQ